MIAVIDNYDSFVHNLSRYIVRLGYQTAVIRNDAITVRAVRAMQPQAIVISPGPCTPDDAGISLEVVRQLHHEIPILGVCLGHQAIATALGGSVFRSPPAHGRSSTIRHDGAGEFERLPSSFEAGRYHSLSVERSTLPDCLHVSAWVGNGTIMAVRHRHYPVFGWQFHPESVLTPHGDQLLRGVFAKMSLSPTNALPTSLTNVHPPTEAQRTS